MILADTSAWIEYMRATESPAHVRLRELVTSGELATTGPVVMEVMAGARHDLDPRRLRRMLATPAPLPAVDPTDYLHAARVYRACRTGGETIRSHLDCLIAAVAIRHRAEILHHDRDFDAIARHTPLVLA